MKKNNLHIGDKIIDSDQIYEIFKIEENKIFYKPLGNTGCTGSIPIGNLTQACIRPLMTKPEIKLFLENLGYEKPIEIPFSASAKVNNGVFLKDILYLNNPERTTRLLIHLSILKRDIEKLSYSDQAIFDQALNHLVEEIALVTNGSIEQVREKILKKIER